MSGPVLALALVAALFAGVALIRLVAYFTEWEPSKVAFCTQIVVIPLAFAVSAASDVAFFLFLFLSLIVASALVIVFEDC